VFSPHPILFRPITESLNLASVPFSLNCGTRWLALSHLSHGQSGLRNESQPDARPQLCLPNLTSKRSYKSATFFFPVTSLPPMGAPVAAHVAGPSLPLESLLSVRPELSPPPHSFPCAAPHLPRVPWCRACYQSCSSHALPPWALPSPCPFCTRISCCHAAARSVGRPPVRPGLPRHRPSLSREPLCACAPAHPS
jgi:hypothetical protein